MIHNEERPLVHRYLIVELAIRALQQDYAHYSQLKMQKYYLYIVEQTLQRLRPTYTTYKHQLATKHIYLIKIAKVDDYFCEAHFATAGANIALRYANEALKKQVEQCLLHFCSIDVKK